MDYYPHGEADENIRKHWSNTPDNEPSRQIGQLQPTSTENDAHQMTAHGATVHGKTSAEDQMTFDRVVKINSLPPRAMNSVSPQNTVILQVEPENNRDIPKIETILSDQTAPPTHVNFESQFFQKFQKKYETFRSHERNPVLKVL